MVRERSISRISGSTRSLEPATRIGVACFGISASYRARRAARRAMSAPSASKPVDEEHADAARRPEGDQRKRRAREYAEPHREGQSPKVAEAEELPELDGHSKKKRLIALHEEPPGQQPQAGLRAAGEREHPRTRSRGGERNHVEASFRRSNLPRPTTYRSSRRSCRQIPRTTTSPRKMMGRVAARKPRSVQRVRRSA